MYLYLDLVFLLNFLIDYLLLWMTAMFRKVEVRKSRLAWASCLGSMYVIIMFSPTWQSLYTFYSKILLSLIMVWLAFGYGHFQKFISTFAMFYFVSFVTGGGMLAVHYVLQSNYRLAQGILLTASTGFGDRVAWWFVLIGFPLMYWFTQSRWKQVEVLKYRLNHLVSVHIYVHQQKVSCLGLIDTGNQLSSPITKTPVIIVEAGLLQEILPANFYVALEMMKGATLGDIEKLEQCLGQDKEWLAQFCLIPYRGIGQQMNLLVALRPERVEVLDEEHTYASKEVLIGLSEDVLSKTGEFQAIVHPQLLETRLIIHNHEIGRGVDYV